MSATIGPKLETNQLAIYLDATNTLSYPRSGTAWTDLSGNNKNGTLTNGPVFNFVENSFVFDGTNDYVDIANTATGITYANSTFTVSLWFKQSSLSNGALISKNGATSGWSIWALSDGTIVTYFKNNSVDSYDKYTSAVITPNTWIHLVSVITTSTTVTANNSVTHYVNGVANTGTELKSSTYVDDTSSNIFLGRRTTTPYFAGNIAFAQIYSRGLSASEALANYNNSKVSFVTSFASDIVKNNLMTLLDAGNTNSYPGTGTTWTDLTGEGRNGTLTNGPTFSTTNGGSIVFDGSNDYVDMGASTYCNIINISFSAWVYLKSGGSVYTIVGRYFNTTQNGFLLYYDLASNKFYADGRESSAAYLSVSTTGSYTTNNWYHFTWTKSANLWSIYINGVLDTSASVGNGTTAFTNNNMWLGAYNVGASQAYGFVNLAQVNIYSKALSATEVLQNYNSLKGRFGY